MNLKGTLMIFKSGLFCCFMVGAITITIIITSYPHHIPDFTCINLRVIDQCDPSLTHQDCWVLHSDARGRGSQGSAHSVVVLETDLCLSCRGSKKELQPFKNITWKNL